MSGTNQPSQLCAPPPTPTPTPHTPSLAQWCRWGTESLVEVPRKDVHPASNVGVVTQYHVGNLSAFGCLTSRGVLIQVQWELKG